MSLQEVNAPDQVAGSRSTARVRGGYVVWAAIVVTTAVRALVIMRSFFWQDDYIHIWTAWNAPAEDLILQEWNGHRQPLTFAVMWALARLWPQTWWPAGLILVLLAALLPTAFWLAVRRLAGVTWAAVIATVAFCLWPGLLIPETWFSSGLETFSLLAILAALGLYARSWTWRVPMIGLLLILGTGFNERALFMGPVLFAAGYLFATGGISARLRHVYRDDRGLWWMLAALTVALVSLSRLLSSGWTGGQPATPADTVQALWFAGPWGVMRDLVGVNAFWPDERTTLPGPIPVWALAVCAVLWLVLGILGLRRDRAQFGHCVLAVAACLVVETAVVEFFRGGFIGPEMHQDPRYYLLTGTIVLLCVSSFGTHGSERQTSLWWVAPFAVVAVLGFLASAVAIARTTDGNQPREWLSTARGQFVGEGKPPLVPTTSPPGMISPMFFGTAESGLQFELGTTRTLLAVGAQQPRIMTSTILPVGADLTGRIAPVMVSPVKSTTVPGFGADCSVSITSAWTRVPMSEGGLGNPLLSIDYLTSEDAVLEVRSGDWRQSASVPPGFKSVWFVPPIGPFSGFDIRVLEGKATFCVGASRAGGGITEDQAVAP